MLTTIGRGLFWFMSILTVIAFFLGFITPANSFASAIVSMIWMVSERCLLISLGLMLIGQNEQPASAPAAK